jgi:hypothetical protein
MVIDGHSHVGNEKFNNRAEIRLEDYIDFIDRVGIDKGLIMPVPCPIVPINCDEFEAGKTLLTWKYDGQKHIFTSEVRQLCSRGLVNPYKEINEYYYSLIKERGLEDRMIFVPIIHPILDTDEYLEELITTMNPVAVKIHSVGTVCSPLDIRDSYTAILREYDVPVIVHTDFNNGNFDKNKGVYEAVRKAEAMMWFCYFENNKIRGTLNHGATLNLDVFDKVNHSKYVRVGIEPSIYFGANYGRLNIDKKIYDDLGFLRVLKKYLSSSKLIFDVDYDYNRTLEHEVDYDVLNRICDVWGNESDDILSTNALDQYPVLRKK